jgi:hypothetical protein
MVLDLARHAWSLPQIMNGRLREPLRFTCSISSRVRGTSPPHWLYNLQWVLSIDALPHLRSQASIILPMPYGRRAGNGGTCILTGPHPSSGVRSEALWAKILVGFWCEDTCHVGSPDLPLELGMWHAHGVSLGRASDWLGHGSSTRPNIPPWSDQGNASLAWYRGYQQTKRRVTFFLWTMSYKFGNLSLNLVDPTNHPPKNATETRSLLRMNQN